jgi:hypothetical protein
MKGECRTCHMVFHFLPSLPTVPTTCKRCDPSLPCHNCGVEHRTGRTCCTHCAIEIREDTPRRMCGSCTALPLIDRARRFEETFHPKEGAYA